MVQKDNRINHISLIAGGIGKDVFDEDFQTHFKASGVKMRCYDRKKVRRVSSFLAPW